MDRWRQQARILHLALVGGVVLALAAFALVRRLGAAPSLDPALARTVGRVAVVLVVLAVTGSSVLGRRLERRPTEDEESWGRRALASLIVRWALVEGAALVAGLAWLLTGGSSTIIAAGAALLVLAFQGPGRSIP